MDADKFFHAGTVESTVLNCYRLAKFYSRDPDEFLSKPLSRISRHMDWTIKLIEKLNAEQQDQND